MNFYPANSVSYLAYIIKVNTRGVATVTVPQYKLCLIYWLIHVIVYYKTWYGIHILVFLGSLISNSWPGLLLIYSYSSTGMEVQDGHLRRSPSQQVLQDNFIELKNSIDYDSIYQYLVQHGLLSTELQQQRTLLGITDLRKLDNILHYLLQQTNALPKLIQCLRKSAPLAPQPQENRELADKLERQLKAAGNLYTNTHPHKCYSYMSLIGMQRYINKIDAPHYKGMICFAFDPLLTL